MFYKIIDGETVFFTGNVLYTETATIINPTDDVMIANGWLMWEDPEPTAEELVQQAKEEKLLQIDFYDSSDAVNEFYLGNIPMWLDAPTRQQLRISIEAYQATGATQVTKWFMGEQFTFPIATWLQMLNALEVYAAEALNVTESHKAAVNALTTVEAIKGHDITVGYPAKLSFMSV